VEVDLIGSSDDADAWAWRMLAQARTSAIGVCATWGEEWASATPWLVLGALCSLEGELSAARVALETGGRLAVRRTMGEVHSLINEFVPLVIPSSF